jgi:hypothetical protein
MDKYILVARGEFVEGCWYYGATTAYSTVPLPFDNLVSSCVSVVTDHEEP